MSQHGKTNSAGKPVAVVIGATSKWQSDGRNTLLAHGKPLDDSDLPVGVHWGIGGAIAQKFAREGFFVVLTTRSEANASGLAASAASQSRSKVRATRRLSGSTASYRLRVSVVS